MVTALILTELKQSTIRYEVPVGKMNQAVIVTDPVGATMTFFEAGSRTKGWVVYGYEVGEEGWEDPETDVLTIHWRYASSIDKLTDFSG